VQARLEMFSANERVHTPAWRHRHAAPALQSAAAGGPDSGAADWAAPTAGAAGSAGGCAGCRGCTAQTIPDDAKTPRRTSVTSRPNGRHVALPSRRDKRLLYGYPKHMSSAGWCIHLSLWLPTAVA
jgi:hypothetical protein